MRLARAWFVAPGWRHHRHKMKAQKVLVSNLVLPKLVHDVRPRESLFLLSPGLTKLFYNQFFSAMPGKCLWMTSIKRSSCFIFSGPNRQFHGVPAQMSGVSKPKWTRLPLTGQTHRVSCLYLEVSFIFCIEKTHNSRRVRTQKVSPRLTLTVVSKISTFLLFAHQVLQWF